jgi:N-acetylmuramoyl-L-alanine amidase
MTGDHRMDGAQPPEEEKSLPASVIFMELMRQAAQAAQPPEPPTAEPTLAESQSSESAAPLTPVEPPPANEAAAADQPEATAKERVDAALPNPLDESTAERDAALEAQRIRRVQRRQAKRRRQTVGLMGGLMLAFVVVIFSAALIATILSWFIDPTTLDAQFRIDLQAARSSNDTLELAAPTGLPTPNWLRQIGIVSGHYGPENDPGAVCMENGVVTLTENEINFSVASRVVLKLRSMGYSVDLLDEWDPRLQNYQAAALVSIHANTCQDFGELVTGYLVAQHEARPEGGEDTRLRECVAEHYAAASELERRFGLTRDMTLTPGVILELGFMLADRDVLTSDPDKLATGVVNGILCFLDPNSLPSAEATPAVAPATPAPGA